MSFSKDFDWVWDELNKSANTLLTCDNRKVNFHMDYSCGTAAIRGNKELAEGQHFWEIKMTSPVYGTDMVCWIKPDNRNCNQFFKNPIRFIHNYISVVSITGSWAAFTLNTSWVAVIALFVVFNFCFLRPILLHQLPTVCIQFFFLKNAVKYHRGFSSINTAIILLA